MKVPSYHIVCQLFVFVTVLLHFARVLNKATDLLQSSKVTPSSLSQRNLRKKKDKPKFKKFKYHQYVPPDQVRPRLLSDRLRRLVVADSSLLSPAGKSYRTTRALDGYAVLQAAGTAAALSSAADHESAISGFRRQSKVRFDSFNPTPDTVRVVCALCSKVSLHA